mmetsp:Transcript_41238/g.89226  ORF Transcript_41238/g.89226 Transcript_41238/m.89226 type:complete len:159 (-) Transcript_41238:355-831(-)
MRAVVGKDATRYFRKFLNCSTKLADAESQIHDLKEALARERARLTIAEMQQTPEWQKMVRELNTATTNLDAITVKLQSETETRKAAEDSVDTAREQMIQLKQEHKNSARQLNKLLHVIAACDKCSLKLVHSMPDASGGRSSKRDKAEVHNEPATDSPG